MPANSPQEVTNLVAQRLNRGDLDGIMALYEPNAGLAPQPGQVLQGAAAIREGFAGFIALKPSMNMESETVIQADDLALVYTEWSLSRHRARWLRRQHAWPGHRRDAATTRRNVALRDRQSLRR